MTRKELPVIGTTALVQTAAFRCLAVMGTGGKWMSAYPPARVIEDVVDFEVCHTPPAEDSAAAGRFASCPILSKIG